MTNRLAATLLCASCGHGAGLDSRRCVQCARRVCPRCIGLRMGLCKGCAFEHEAVLDSIARHEAEEDAHAVNQKEWSPS